MATRPTPDGREWLRPRDIIKSQIDEVVADHPNITRNQMESLRDSLVNGLRRVQMYEYEFKVLRLTERVVDAIEAGQFGPIYIPNTVVEGQQVPTPVGEIALLFRDIYDQEFLDLFDENGNVLESLDPGTGEG